MQLYSFNRGGLRAIIDIEKVGQMHDVDLGIGIQ